VWGFFPTPPPPFPPPPLHPLADDEPGRYLGFAFFYRHRRAGTTGRRRPGTTGRPGPLVVFQGPPPRGQRDEPGRPGHLDTLRKAGTVHRRAGTTGRRRPGTTGRRRPGTLRDVGRAGPLVAKNDPGRPGEPGRPGHSNKIPPGRANDKSRRAGPTTVGRAGVQFRSGTSSVVPARLDFSRAGTTDDSLTSRAGT